MQGSQDCQKTTGNPIWKNSQDLQSMHFLKTLGVSRYNRQGSEVGGRAEASSGQCHADRVEDKRQFKAQSHCFIWNGKWKKRIVCLLLKLKLNHKNRISSNSRSLQEKGRDLLFLFSMSLTHSRGREQQWDFFKSLLLNYIHQVQVFWNSFLNTIICIQF